MIIETTDEDIKDSNPDANIEQEAEDFIDDPIIAEMREAEKEIEALAAGTAEAEGEPKAKAEDAPKAEAQKNKPILVPKARLDEVLSERDLLRSQLAYEQGLRDAQEQMKASADQDKPNTDANKEVQKDSAVDEIEAAISAAEQKKLELAEKYDAGDISTVELRKAEIEIDREVRGLTDKKEIARLTELKEASTLETKAALTAQQEKEWINSQGLVIQQNHPNVALIDSVRPSIRNAIWLEVDGLAKHNLLQRGINVNNLTLATRLELIKEKARLTDTPEILSLLPAEYQAKAKTQQSANSQTNPSPKQPSETALQRAKKLELAESQPPSVADMGHGATDGELTEADIEGLTEDEMADLIQRAPNLVKRAVGSSI